MALVKKFESDFGVISVLRSSHDGGMAYYQNGCFHSQSTRQGISVCAYVHALHEMIRQARARRVLIIGCGGGTLATMLRRLNCRVTVVDINPVSFIVARAYFRLPDDVRCICRDGIAYLRTTCKKYDAVVIDVFGSHNNVPPMFTTEAFFRAVARVLSPSGLMAMNVITANDRDKRAAIIAQRAEAAGMGIALFDWPGQKDRNSLITGNAPRRLRLPSGREPAWMREDMRGLTRLGLRKRLP
ncbi:MAG: fused MFS/spermidine synthase [Alphaproteobacteria bacterium]|nr:fused MFS/spermidine synthase [Alphaproteobacteria bacterium]